ncbi:carboxymuconolactone decarboxylase family protein [Nocardia sp. alder85J]|uniref:carboxymuconolactone decarboxylase family protein n=1 Tax=Nocardia sp. alder85J TaxID=2862949 RepID=UPI001CD40102|nr:carboxymuconolactone decarboxylase family protein [Nocardia sp. alder85J]MCX4094937.1 carboxymuconolactone decarboxylase family protein [Nocardia sp. alder85J]
MGEPARIYVDKQHPAAYHAQLEVAKAVQQATEAAGLFRRLVELLNIRVSQLNRCAFCLDLHTREALAHGETAQRVATLPAWRDTLLFDDRERAALTLAESLTTLPSDRDQDRDYADAATHLTPEQLSAVSWVVIAMNAFNRISIVSRHPVRPRHDAETVTTTRSIG